MKRRLRLQLLRLARTIRRPAALPVEAARILVVRPDHLGDLILAGPALTALRQAFPESGITAWVGPWGEEVWRNNANINNLRVCPFPGFARKSKGTPLEPYRLLLAEAASIAGQFDLAINLRFDFWWGALAANWARIPVVGYSIAECAPFLSLPVRYVPDRHEVDQNVSLVCAVAEHFGRQPSVESPSLSFQAAADVPQQVPSGAIAIHPGAGAAVKLWDECHWAEVADSLAAEGPILLTVGSQQEQAMAERICGHMHESARILQGLSLAQLASVYRSCRLVLGVDNGPLHLARAAGTPTVTLFGPIDPLKFGPYPSGSLEHEVVRLPWRCIPCERLDYNHDELQRHLCVRLIAPEDVLQAAHRVLSSRSPQI